MLNNNVDLDCEHKDFLTNEWTKFLKTTTSPNIRNKIRKVIKLDAWNEKFMINTMQNEEKGRKTWQKESQERSCQLDNSNQEANAA